MFGDLSFRKKIILSQLILFIAFFAALFPFVEKMSSILVRDSLIESTSDLKMRLAKATSVQDMVSIIKKEQYFFFFRIGLINDQGLVIYDTHKSRLYKEGFKPYFATDHKEIQEALKEGVGFSIAHSVTFGGKFGYVAERFQFQGKTFILRTVFPFQQIEDLTETFEIGMLIFLFVILLFFNTLIMFIFNRLTRPIREIISAITPYQKKEQAELPEITLTKTTGPGDDFQKLAGVFNSLSRKIQEQIKTLEDEKNEKEAILESLGEGVIAVDGKMHVLYINFIACKMLGVARRQILGKPFHVEGGNGAIQLSRKCRDLLEKCQSQAIIAADSIILGTEKKTYIDLVAAPKAHGAGAIIVLQDKTSHYRVLEMGKDFVANASHELRTPITIIKGFAETLHDMPEMSNELLMDVTEKIGRNCTRMENLVSNLLMLADIENLPESRFEECDLGILLENCRHTLLSVHPEAHVEIDKSGRKVVIGADRGLLELALMNLLENAAKYSDPPAKISLVLTIPNEEEVILKISDQGRGIPERDLPHIFERFYRVDKTHSRRLGGAGLGLSLVKTIIKKHDGTIEVESTEGKGTTFTITLPIRHHNWL
ncbi:MAG: Sensor histidine kinase ResE [Chlamydiae bacterium]|nr:Sensor histidine kinase ResE [Chlamydiota bacterium]